MPSSAALVANWDKDYSRLSDARLGSLEPGLTKRDKETPSTLQPVACWDLPCRALYGRDTRAADITAVPQGLRQGSVPCTAGHLPQPPELALLLAAPQAWNWECTAHGCPVPLLRYSCQGPRKGAKMSHLLSVSEELGCPHRRLSISSAPEVLDRGFRPSYVNPPIGISETDMPSFYMQKTESQNT